MPVTTSKANALKFEVGEEYIMDLSGDDVKVKCEALGKKDDDGKKLISVIDETNAETYDCYPHELKALPAKKGKKEDPEEEEVKPKKTKKAESEEQEEEEKVKPKGKTSGGFWSKTKTAEDFATGLPIGTWEALAFNGESEDKGKGWNIFLEVVGVNADGDDAKKVNGIKNRIYYQIFDKNGEYNEVGAGILRKDLIKVGFTEDDLNSMDDSSPDSLREDLDLLLKKLRKREPWISVKIVKQKNDDRYTQCYIQGLMEDQDDKPANPLEGFDK